MSGKGTVMLVKNRSTRLVWFIIIDRRSTNNNIRMAAEPAIHRHSLIHAIPAWYPLFKPIPILLILGIIFLGNRVSRLSRIPP
ncbi:hypothetical protein CEE35_02020 [Candidatus Aerophobetes bacterium Ae_b3b]|nr:MAG: hypothetical protein CEE35_02020 [Candidatus Aerophobetes bacterium Ae_b3b]